MRAISVFFAVILTLATGSASAAVYMIGDNDGYGLGIPDNAPHPFNGSTANYDGRSVAEAAATDGAQYTDTYSTTHPGFGPQPGTIATFTFSGLGNGWGSGVLEIDMADFQASTFGAVSVDFNGIFQNWAFNDGFPNTVIRTTSLSQAVIDSINNLGMLVVTINRNNSADFYGFDYAKLELSSVVPIPAAFWLFGSALMGLLSIPRRNTRLAA